jgi:hypothetical protein
LREKFPEDLTQVESYFSGWMTLQARAEDDYAGLRCRLDSVRDQVSQRLLRTVNPAARATLLDAVRERLMVRDAALSAVRAEPPASGPVALQPTLGHPPRRPRAPKPRVERSRPGPPARPAGAPDAAGSERGSVTVDLEQLIQEMDSQ